MLVGGVPLVMSAQCDGDATMAPPTGVFGSPVLARRVQNPPSTLGQDGLHFIHFRLRTSSGWYDSSYCILYSTLASIVSPSSLYRSVRCVISPPTVRFPHPYTCETSLGGGRPLKARVPD